jgi:tetratricopeptide (TPR) repeat protein
MINVFPLFIQYLEKLLLPLNLNAFYVLHPISSILNVKGLVSLTVTAAFVVWIIKAFKGSKFVCFSLLVVALPILPSLYIPAVGENVFAERYLYLPSFGFVLLIVLALSWAMAIKPGLTSSIIIISLMMAVAYSIGTVNRNAVWRNNLTLFTDTVKKSPDAPIPMNNLGNTYLKQNRLDEAIIEYKTALSLNPGYADAHNNLGNVYLKQNRLDEAIIEYKTALSLNPGYADAHNNLGLAYDKRNRLDEAIVEYKTALSLQPDIAEVHKIRSNLGDTYSKQNRLDEAIIEYKTAISLQPNIAEVHNNLGVAYLKRNRLDEAIVEYKTAISLKPDIAEAHNNLGVASLKQNRLDEAVNEFTAALKLKSDYAEARGNLEICYERMKR